MQRLEANGAVRPIYGSLSVKRLIINLCYAFYPAKNRYLPDFMYSYYCQTNWDPNIHTAPMT